MASPAESTPRGSDSGDDDDDLFSRRGCCHWMPFFRSGRSNGSESIWWERIDGSPSPDARERRWWCKAVKKLRGWSELVAGHKWKTFTRRFNKTGRSKKTGRFKYDPLSYALNFDAGSGDGDGEYRDFSSRYATIPILVAKASMDLGRDAPAFA